MTKLKPCPFCGERKEIEAVNYELQGHSVVCRFCGALGPEELCESNAIAAWNRRATPRRKP